MGETEKNLWPGWETVRLIGQGSFGAVYEIQRELFGETEKAALKVITIPRTDSEIDELRSEGLNDESITQTFNEQLKDIVGEYKLMKKLSGSTNIVNCDDVDFIQRDESLGWDIFIKMELLTPLTKALSQGLSMTEGDVIRLGEDMCKALILCRKHNIIHRDIKPANIFISENGDYKLGDFGIAKMKEQTSSGTAKIGTYDYMAPEVYNSEEYGSTVDIYSLGMVLYWLLNEKRAPFLAQKGEYPTQKEKEEARKRRFQGELIPAPAHGSEELKQIVLKACAYDPKDRYQSAAEMLSALEGLGKPAGQETISLEQQAEKNDDPTEGFGWKGKGPKPEEDKTVGAWTKQKNEAEPEEEKTVSAWGKKEPDKTANGHGTEGDLKKKKYIWIIAACLALAIVLVGGIIWLRGPVVTEISAGDSYTLGLRSDGTVVAVGDSWAGQCDVTDWSNIVAISADNFHTVGLRSDGTAVAVGNNNFYGECDVSDWRDIVSISAGEMYTVGLRSDGTVVAVGDNYDGRCDVSDWCDIVAISAGCYHTVGLRTDGTVVAVGRNTFGQCDVSDWRDIVSISAGWAYTMGLRSDGTVVAVGDNYYGQCDLSDWSDIVSISAGNNHAVGLRADGTVVAAGYNRNGQCYVSGLSDIVSISAGEGHTVGLRADGTVVAVGSNSCGQCDVSDW